MRATDAHIIRIAGGDIPPSRHVHRLIAIFNNRAIVNFVKVQRHVYVGAVALRGEVEGGGVSSSARVQRVALTSTQLASSPAAAWPC